MHEWDDAQLLFAYANRQSEEAFGVLVERHIGLVYSAALRQVQNPHLAEEVTQAAFTILAQKARQLKERTVLSGWLCRTAHFVARNALKAEFRRQYREKEALMQSLINQPEEDAWRQLAPLLDEAVAHLSEADRNAVVLRYYERKPLREVGDHLGIAPAAAQMRLSRALEKLRKFFVRKGLTLSAAAIAGAVSANSVHAAPAALAKSVTAVALAKGAAASTSTLALIKGALKLMAWTKAKTALITGAVVLLAAGTTAVTVHEIRKPKFNPDDFWATSYPMDMPTTNSYGQPLAYGQPLDWTFPVSSVQGRSISELLDDCMAVSGWRYLIDKDVTAGTVQFGSSNVMYGEEWVAAIESALQNGRPKWLDQKTGLWRQENLVLIRYPAQKTVLVLPQDKATAYQ